MLVLLITKKLNRLRKNRKKKHSYQGFTLLELLIILALVGIMVAIAAPNISFGVNPLVDVTNRVAGNFKLVRAKAMSQTSAYRISPNSATDFSTLKVEKAKSCYETNATNWTQDPSFTQEDLSLNEVADVKGISKNTVIQIKSATANGTTVTPATNWTLCYNSQGVSSVSYNSQGVSSVNLLLILRNTKTNQEKKIEIFAGGGVYVYQN